MQRDNAAGDDKVRFLRFELINPIRRLVCSEARVPHRFKYRRNIFESYPTWMVEEIISQKIRTALRAVLPEL